MIQIYIDTNIYINSIENRDDGVSRELLLFLSQTDAQIYCNDITLINISYITRKSIHRDEIAKRLKVILKENTLVCANSEIINQAPQWYTK